MAHKRLVAPGSFCWRKGCQDYGKVNHGNIRRFGKTGKGVQRFQCKTCKGTFTESKGALFYRRHTPQETILDCLAMVVERNSLAAVHRMKGVKEETLLDWLREAAQHIEEIEALLLANYRCHFSGYTGPRSFTQTGPVACTQSGP